MKKLRILIDLDGVVFDFTRRWVELANYKYGLCLKDSDIDDWEMYKCTGGRLSKKKANAIIWESGFFRHMVPIKGAIYAIEVMNAAGHDIYFVTACKAGGFQDKEDCLSEHLTFPPKMVFTEHKHVVAGDLLVDDKLSNLINWQKDNPGGTALCFAQPYNSEYKGFRAPDWNGVLTMVNYKATPSEAYELSA